MYQSVGVVVEPMKGIWLCIISCNYTDAHNILFPILDSFILLA